MAFLDPDFAIAKLIRDSAGVQAASSATVSVSPLGSVGTNAAMPFICYQRTSSSPQHHMGGVASTNLEMGSTEITAFAETMDAVKALSDAIQAALDGAEPVTVTIGGNSATFERLHLTSKDMDVFQPADASDTRVFTVTQDYGWSARP